MLSLLTRLVRQLCLGLFCFGRCLCCCLGFSFCCLFGRFLCGRLCFGYVRILNQILGYLFRHQIFFVAAQVANRFLISVYGIITIFGCAAFQICLQLFIG